MSSLLRRLWRDAQRDPEPLDSGGTPDLLVVFVAQSPLGPKLALSRAAAVAGLSGCAIDTDEGLLGAPVVAEIRLPVAEARLWLELTFGEEAADALFDDFH